MQPRRVRSGGGPVLALAVVLLLVAGGAMAGAWYFLKGRAEAEQSAREAIDEGVTLGDEDEPVPFDEVDPTGDDWVLEINAPWRWSSEPEGVDQLRERLGACRAFLRDGRFARMYPEADGKTVRVRITFQYEPGSALLPRVREVLAAFDDLKLELVGLS